MPDQDLAVGTLNRQLPPADEPSWRQDIRQQLETDIEKRVREALSTPPIQRLQRRRHLQQRHINPEVDLNSHLLLGQSPKDRLKNRRWRPLKPHPENTMPFPSSDPAVDLLFKDRDQLSKSNQDEFPGVFGLENLSEGIKNIREDFTNVVNRIGTKPKARHFYTKEGFLKAVRGGNLPQGVREVGETGQYVDKYGVVRDSDGPFWPMECIPLFPTPRFGLGRTVEAEPLYGHLPGMYEYELVLKSDLYTRRHTQWYFFRVHNAQPGITYKFNIVNLLKPDSLYNYGMRPLLYSEKEAEDKQKGWIRCGHHITYTKNYHHLSCPLLPRSLHHYQLEWQMEFPREEDSCYLAHCYPYTFTDLKGDIVRLTTRADSKGHVKREVLCESWAGNSCFLLTITNFEKEDQQKKAVVITGRVHPGESQASWMMKGLLDFLTSPHPSAQELRDKIVFKIVPMLNPDGVIVGNYRCSLAARDLNRNYRHPRRDVFPTIHAVKAMMEQLASHYEIMVYCDLHGHSRKHNVFMYGNNTSLSPQATTTTTGEGRGEGAGEGEGEGAVRSFLSERLFPWLMATTCRDKFSFPGCKFHIQRCKEATGRVVMWRQLNVFNSFTLEASFSGTILDPQVNVFNSFTLEASFSGTILDPHQRHHFNVHDLMDVGRALAMTVLEYHQLQDDPLKQTQTILEMTEAFTHQILQKRRSKEATSNTAKVDPAPTTATATATIAKQPSTSVPEQTSRIDTKMELVREDTDKWMSAILNLLRDKSDLDLGKGRGQGENDPGQGGREEGMGRKSSFLSSTRATGNETEVRRGQGRASVSAIDGCLSVLAALNVREMLEESDSSDSDSESEPEMSAKEERKPRKKKRKSRKRRDREHQHPHPKKPPHPADKKVEGGDGGKKFRYRACSAAQKAAPIPERPVLIPKDGRKQQCQFLSKYDGRHNGGLPCFTEERSAERAAKRVMDNQRRGDEDKLKEMTCLSFEELGSYVPPYPSHLFPLPPAPQGSHSNRPAQGASNGDEEAEGARIRNFLLNSLARTGYTHADTPGQAYPSSTKKVHSIQLFGHLSPSSNPHHHQSSFTHHPHPPPTEVTGPDSVHSSDAGTVSNVLPPLEDRGMSSRHILQEPGSRKIVRRHSSPSTSASSSPPLARHHDNRPSLSDRDPSCHHDNRLPLSSRDPPHHHDNRLPLSSREPLCHHDNQASPRVTKSPKAAFVAPTERPPCHHFAPGRAPLIQGLKASVKN